MEPLLDWSGLNQPQQWFKDTESGNIKIRKFAPYGDVRDPFTLYAKGVADLEGDIALARIVNNVLDNPGWTKSVATGGYVELGQLRSPFKNIEKLRGKWIQKGIIHDGLGTYDLDFEFEMIEYETGKEVFNRVFQEDSIIRWGLFEVTGVLLPQLDYHLLYVFFNLRSTFTKSIETLLI